KVVHHYCAAIVSIWLTSRIYRRSVWKITARPS
ncbi:putative two-component system response regulator, partial [Escherichia coli H296]